MGGNNETSASRELSMVQSSFQGENKKDLRALFKLSDNKKDFEHINEKDFANAIAGQSVDDQALAYGYYSAINSKDYHTVEVISRDEKYDSKMKEVIEKELFLNTNYKPIGKGIDVDRATGGGLNYTNPDRKNGSRFWNLE
ncbi:hypothetical protein A4H97_34000 [Niastella yeongjuensis]|uniref:Uncharacterized protein n=1 Tax=Niastella yeongjuensis TaxID=354355 RepID=A0A1V9EBD6_9BACT|nr:hypothetical protein [Niastella yeongjuensis]OQP43429.1 hypothetical protein A4H97_34000 [Niastella yeongjuensis]SEP48172.1 hypothetical protein SAMN05660816_06703 [Niastella yeongjuensis]